MIEDSKMKARNPDSIYEDPRVTPCCGDWDNCSKACVPRAEFWKNKSKNELNKLALSILCEALNNDEYYEIWKERVTDAFYEAALQIDQDSIINRDKLVDMSRTGAIIVIHNLCKDFPLYE